MKLDLEYDAGFAWKCTRGKHHNDPSAPMAVIGNKESGGPSSGLCLNHLYALEVMGWDTAFIPKAVTGTLRDAVIAEFYRVFPEPEPEPLVPCPVCGWQPVWRKESRDYCCFHSETLKVCALWTYGKQSEPEARAAWNSMRHEPVVSAADAPKTKWQVWNVTPPCAITVNGVQSFDSRDEAIKERDSFRRSFPGYAYEVREVPA